MKSQEFDESFFRHEFGKLVSALSRRVGPQNLASIEDAVQSALLVAIEKWPQGETPDHPRAWLYTVAYNNLVGEFRRNGKVEILPDDVEDSATTFDLYSDQEIADDLLRFLFVCCDPAISLQSQLILALKTLCGFSAKEIAFRLFSSEALVYKRLERARMKLSDSSEFGQDLASRQLMARLPAVKKILYLMFTEGYWSSLAEAVIRKELCQEALRLASILAEHPVLGDPEASALMALMHFHSARVGARESASGGLLLLEEQDRSLWDREQIGWGLMWLAKSAVGDSFTRYHAEAGVAAEHCLAPSFEETRWDKVVACYGLLEKLAPSPLHKLNCAVAIAEWVGPLEALQSLEGFVPPSWLDGSFFWAAILADLHRRVGAVDKAERYFQLAYTQAPSPAIGAVFERRFRQAKS